MNFQTVFEELSNLYEEMPAEEAVAAEESLTEDADEEVLIDDEPIVEDEPVAEEELTEEDVPEETAPADDEPKQVVLECSKCGALVIKDDADIKADGSTDLVNTEDECQYCEEAAGYTIVGAVAPYTVAEADDAAEVIENDVATEETDAVEEGLFSKKVKEPYEVLPSKLKKGMTVIGPDGDEYKIKDVIIDGKNVHILHKDGSISTSDAMNKKYKVIAE